MKKTSREKDIYVWIDLEMTGIDESVNQILEAAMCITTPSLKFLLDCQTVAIKTEKSVIEQMDEWNTFHHTKSGLVEKVQSDLAVDIAYADKQFADFVMQHKSEGFNAILAGTSVHHDLRFIKKYMPRLFATLFHRIIDVSSFKEVILFHNPDFKLEKQRINHHTASADIEYSIEQFRSYLSFLNIQK